MSDAPSPEGKKQCPHIVWALRQGKERNLTAGEMLTLMVLSEMANSAMFCCPSLPALSDITRLDERTVRKALTRLAELQLIRVGLRLRQTSVYHVLRPADASEGVGTKMTPPQMHPSDKNDPTPDAKFAVGVGTILSPDSLKKERKKENKEGTPLYPPKGGIAVEDPAPVVLGLLPPEPTPTADPVAATASQQAADEGPNGQERRGETIRRRRRDAAESPAFVEWWALYPRKQGGRAGAWVAYQRAIARGASDGQLIEGLRCYAFNPDPTKQPYAQTWLHDGRWGAEPDTAPPTVESAPETLWDRILRPDADDEDDAPPSRATTVNAGWHPTMAAGGGMAALRRTIAREASR